MSMSEAKPFRRFRAHTRPCRTTISCLILVPPIRLQCDRQVIDKMLIGDSQVSDRWLAVDI